MILFFHKTAKPAPSVIWYFDDTLIDDSYFSEQRGLSRNELQLTHLNRSHLNGQLTCRSQNSNLTKATQTTLTIDFIRKYFFLFYFFFFNFYLLCL